MCEVVAIPRQSTIKTIPNQNNPKSKQSSIITIPNQNNPQLKQSPLNKYKAESYFIFSLDYQNPVSSIPICWFYLETNITFQFKNKPHSPYYLSQLLVQNFNTFIFLPSHFNLLNQTSTTTPPWTLNSTNKSHNLFPLKTNRIFSLKEQLQHNSTNNLPFPSLPFPFHSTQHNSLQRHFNNQLALQAPPFFLKNPHPTVQNWHLWPKTESKQWITQNQPPPQQKRWKLWANWTKGSNWVITKKKSLTEKKCLSPTRIWDPHQGEKDDREEAQEEGDKRSAWL